MKLKVTANTVLKTEPKQSSELSDDRKASLSAGEYEIKDYEDRGSHLFVDFLAPIANRTEWYIFEGHVDTLTLDSYPENTDSPEPKKEGPFKLPGYSKTFYLSEPIVEGGHFTWAEATKNGTRIPVNSAVVENIFSIARKMEDVRSLFGNVPISVTSWYRDPVSNRRCGGASRSQHLTGGAVDFNVAGLTPRQVQQKLESHWQGGMGYGKTFTHLDNRNYRARWNYGS